METISCIKERRSVRRFLPREVEDEVLNDIISAAAFAPSWKNTQISRYNIVKSEDVRKKIAEEGVCGFEGNKNIVLSCGALVVLSYKNGRSGYERDGSFSTTKGEMADV